MTEVRQGFNSRMHESHDAVMRAVHWLTSRGHTVTVSGVNVAPSADQWRDYVDGGDLFIQQRVEVKRVSHNFTCADDWRYGKNFIVCGKNAFDRAVPVPHVFICMSQDMTHAAVVDVAKTRSSWWVDTKDDKNYSAPQTFYMVDTSKVTFVKVPL